MSDTHNDMFIENLYNRLADIIERVSPDAAEQLHQMIENGDLADAEEFLEMMEAVHADDL